MNFEKLEGVLACPTPHRDVLFIYCPIMIYDDFKQWKNEQWGPFNEETLLLV